MQYPCSRSRVLGSAEGWTYLYKICPAPLLAPELHVTKQQPMGSVHCCFSISHKECGVWGVGDRRGGKTLFLKAALNSFLVTVAVLGIPVSCWKMFLYRAPGLTLPPFWAAPDESSGERKQDKKTSSHMLQNDLRHHYKSETLIYHSCIR